MRDVIDMIFAYRTLLAQRSKQGLSAAKEAQLNGVERLMNCDMEPGWRAHDRVEADRSATIEVDGERHDVRVVNMSGGGVCIASAPPLPQGERATLHVQGCGFIYQLGVVVRWYRGTTEGSVMGMPFVGTPVAIPDPRDQSGL